MRKTLLSLLIASSCVCAEQVTVTGYGSNYESALKNAKTQALESVTGTFIIAENTARNGRVTEEIDQYNGGVIKSYTMVSNNVTPMGYEVTINADVVPKDNRVVRETAGFAPNYAEFNQRVGIVTQIDDVGKAIAATVVNPRYAVGRYSTTMSGTIVMSFQPKWLSDVKAFSMVVNEKGNTEGNLYNRMHGGAVSGLLSVSPVAAVAVAVVGQRPPAPLSNAMMVCFDSSSDCNTIGVALQGIPRTPKLVLVGVASGSEHVLYEHILDMKMYQFYHAGQTVSNSYFNSFKTTYQQPTLMLNTRETQAMNVSFNVDNELAKQLTAIRVYLK